MTGDFVEAVHEFSLWELDLDDESDNLGTLFLTLAEEPEPSESTKTGGLVKG